jgi:hypothetical protein
MWLCHVHWSCQCHGHILFTMPVSVKPFFSPDFKFWLYQHSNSSPGDLEGCRRTNTLHVFTEHFTWKMLAFGTEARSDSAPLSLMAGTTLGDGDVGTGTRAWDVKSDIEAQGTEGPVSYKFPKGKPLSNKMPYETKLWSSEISHLLWKTQVQVSVSFFSDNSITQNSEMGIRNGKKNTRTLDSPFSTFVQTHGSWQQLATFVLWASLVCSVGHQVCTSELYCTSSR